MSRERKNEESKVKRTGLCADCAHARRVESSRGSVFVLCERSASDPAYAKYPRLPMRDCPGYAPSKR
jgi:hypothetical protein